MCGGYTDYTRSYHHPGAQFWVGSSRNWSVFLERPNTGRHEKAPVRCPCSRLAALHGAPRTRLICLTQLTNNNNNHNNNGYYYYCIDETCQSFTPQQVSSFIGEQAKRILQSAQLKFMFFVVKIERIPLRSQQCFRTHRVVQYCAFDCQTGPTSYHCKGPHTIPTSYNC